MRFGFSSTTVACERTRDVLAAAPDVARALSRLTVGRGRPRDLAEIRDGLVAAMELAAQIDGSPAVALPKNIVDAQAQLAGHGSDCPAR